MKFDPVAISAYTATTACGIGREALRVAGVEPGGWSGSGTFQGAWRGTLAEPVFQGRFTGQQVGFLGVNWGRAEWTGASEPQRIRMDSLVVRKDGAEVARAATDVFSRAQSPSCRSRSGVKGDVVVSYRHATKVTPPAPASSAR